jgi:hypothetical protein
LKHAVHTSANGPKLLSRRFKVDVYRLGYAAVDDIDKIDKIDIIDNIDNIDADRYAVGASK